VSEEWETYTDEERGAWHELQANRVASEVPTVGTWADIHPELSTGDLIFFRCSDTYGSALVTLFTGEWSHIGMVVVVHGQPSRVTGRRPKHILLWESVSHPDGLEDFGTREEAAGVRLVDLKKRLLTSPSHYYGVAKFAHASLERQRQICAEFVRIFMRESGKPYSHSKLRLCRVALDCGALGHNTMERRPSRYFCSELVCRTLQELGVISADVKAARSCPTDFWSYRYPFERGSRTAVLYYMPRLEHPACPSVQNAELAPPGSPVRQLAPPGRFKGA
jgi:hypothetical protein